MCSYDVKVTGRHTQWSLFLRGRFAIEVVRIYSVDLALGGGVSNLKLTMAPTFNPRTCVLHANLLLFPWSVNLSVNKQRIAVFALFCSFFVAGAYLRNGFDKKCEKSRPSFHNYVLRTDSLISELSNQIFPYCLTIVSL